MKWGRQHESGLVAVTGDKTAVSSGPWTGRITVHSSARQPLESASLDGILHQHRRGRGHSVEAGPPERGDIRDRPASERKNHPRCPKADPVENLKLGRHLFQNTVYHQNCLWGKMWTVKSALGRRWRAHVYFLVNIFSINHSQILKIQGCIIHRPHPPIVPGLPSPHLLPSVPMILWTVLF